MGPDRVVRPHTPSKGAASRTVWSVPYVSETGE